MKRGTKVAVCHDGKWSRRLPGYVVATRQSHHVLVEFQHEDKVVQFWARKRPTVRYLKSRSFGCVEVVTLKRYAYFGGWAAIDWFRPWFAVHKWKSYEDRQTQHR